MSDTGAILPEGTTVINLNDARMSALAKAAGRLFLVDRRTEWGNPFLVDGDRDGDGDRDTVVDRYRDEYLPAHPELLARISELKGKALACWCAPQRCHADILAELAERPDPMEPPSDPAPEEDLVVASSAPRQDAGPIGLDEIDSFFDEFRNDFR